MATVITAKQSRQARSLLKWNVQDVVNKCALQMRRIDHFERGIVRLSRTENDALVKVYIDNGIAFTRDYDVRLIKKEDSRKTSTSLKDYKDTIVDKDELDALHHGTEEKKINLQEETEKEWNERVRRLVNTKEDDDD